MTEMSPAEALFFAAAALPTSERASYLAQACAGRDDLRQRVEQMLAAQPLVGNFLEPPARAADATSAHAPDHQPPTEGHGDPPARVGAVLAGKYKLIEEIGEGGMGSVYMAQQTEPVKRAVAVKVIKAGMDSKAVLVRFEAERQALAMMDHPNIARVLDAGTTDGGRPFFVMELVKGTPITQYCDDHKLSLRQRLELFVPVCLAIQHAHQKGIIHRDIKPSNVLVAMYDDRPVPKVIDFGVAKAAGQTLTDRTLMTGFGAVVGTPEYMSPEQANLNNLDIDTRSDVYSLGVLLYELLTGSTPVDRKSLGKAALLEILRIVREVEAPRPSARLSSSDTLPSVAANRGTETAKLSKLMKGELDWVLLKALEKDRARRYDTANALSRDIQRYLADEVVEARPPSAGYRLKKFVRRHKGQVLAASLVLLTLLAGMAGTTWGLFEARKQEQEARKQEQFARQETDDKEKALLAEAERVKERDYQLGISYFLLAAAAYDNGDAKLAAERLNKVPQDQRHWEWAYLKRQTLGGLFTLYGHTGGVTSASFSPDRAQIVTGSADGTAKVWDARTGTHLLDLKGHASNVTSVSFSPDGARIVTGSEDNTAKVWDARTGTPLLDLKGHTQYVRSVSFSPDGARIVTGSGDSTVKVWDARTGTPLLDLKGHTSWVTSVSFSPDGARIITASSDRTAKVWDSRTGRPLLDLKGHTQYVGSVYTGRSVSFSPDGTRIVTASHDKDSTAKVWDARTGTPLLDLKGRTSEVTSVSFSPDGTRIVTGSVGIDMTGEAKVWDARTGMPLFDLKGHMSPVRSVSFSPDGTRIVTGSGDAAVRMGVAKVWDARTGMSLFDLKGHRDPVTSVGFSPDGARIVTGGQDWTAKVWDARTATPLFEVKGQPGPIESVRFFPDGTRIVTCSTDKMAKVWDARTGTPLLDLKGHMGSISSVSFSPDGTRIVTASQDKDSTAKVWDAGTGKVLLDLKGHTGSGDHTAKVWDAHTGTPLFDLKGHREPVTSVSFSPDGARIVTGSGDSTAKVWDAHTGTPLLDLKGHMYTVLSVSFSPDGVRIVTGSGDSTAMVWDARTGTPLLDLKGHTQYVRSVSFSPDGARIVTGSGDSTVKVWDARTGTPLLDLKGHTSWVTSVSFSPDGTRIITGSHDRTAKVWDARAGQELKGDRPLEAEERDYRLLHTRPNAWHYAEDYEAARTANDPFAARFNLDRLLSIPEQRTTQRFRERNALPADPLVIARTGFHHATLANTPYDHGTVALLAVQGDRLAQRLVAQEHLRKGQPGPAVPLLFWCLASRPATSPPVEELLLAQAYLDLKQPDEARRFHQAATEWLDRPWDPKDGLGVGFAPNGDPRRNPFDWEAWHECDVFRADVERRLVGKP